MVLAKTARKASAKVKGLLFDGWWRERVAVETGASIALGDFFADYRRECSGAGMSLRNFEDRLRGKGIRVTLRKGARWCPGVRLRTEEEIPVALPPVTVAFASDDILERPGHASPVDAGGAALVRVTPYNPGESETATMLMLDVSTVDDLASGRVAEELFRARVRQRAPVEAGGEGFSNDRDDHYAGDLALAASAYAFAAGQPEDYRAFLELNGKPHRAANFGWHVLEIVRRLWPWDAAWWKPRTPREDLVRAGALVIAAIEKHDRKEARGRLSAEEQLKATGV